MNEKLTMKNYWLIFVSIIGLAIYLLSKLAFPFIVGLVLAYCFKPVNEIVSKYIRNDSIASFTSTTIMVIFFIALFYCIVPQIANSIYEAIKYLPQYISNYPTDNILPNTIIRFLKKYVNTDVFDISPYISDCTGLLLGFLSRLVSFNVNLISLLLISPFVVFFVFRDRTIITDSIYKWIPPSQRSILNELSALLDTALMSYIKSQLLISGIMLTYYTLALSAIGFHKSIEIGIFSGILSFLPYAGCIVGFILSLIIGLTVYGFTSALLPLLVIYFLGYVIEIYILAPRFGKNVGLHTIWIFLALFIGIQINGLFGLFMAIPFAIFANITIRYLLSKFQESKIYKQ